VELVKCEGVILRRIKYGDTSIIATLFTKEFGKVSLMAKGIKSSKSKTSSPSALEPLNRVEAVCYFKPTRAIQLINSIDIVNDYGAIKSDLWRIESAMSVIRGLDLYGQEHDPSKSIWGLLISALDSISDSNEKSFPNCGIEFRAALISSAGFKPSLDNCAVCGAKIEKASVFSALNGGIICKDCSFSGIQLSLPEIFLLRDIFNPIDFGQKRDWSGVNPAKIERIVKEFEEFHTGRKNT
jgi:DNA repair protein RecO (recombination protein O)